jgi:hypothetical protein
VLAVAVVVTIKAQVSERVARVVVEMLALMDQQPLAIAES